MFSGPFSAKTLKALAAKGIRIVGAQTLPGPNGDYASGDVAYLLDDNGTGRLRTFRQVLDLASTK
jgi:hypothetical protein